MNYSLSIIKDKIKKSLEEYKELFYSDELYALRKKYPRYVALYTPLIEQPDFAIIGTNPSWFIGKPPENENEEQKENERTESLKDIHDINAYIKYKEPTYHQKVRDFFELYIKKLNLEVNSCQVDEYINENVMGWNSQFIQTGSKGYGKLKKYCMNEGGIFSEIFLRANEISDQITNLAKPKVIIHFGSASRDISGEYQGEKIKRREDFGFRVFFHHPSQGYSNLDRDEDIASLIPLIDEVTKKLQS